MIRPISAIVVLAAAVAWTYGSAPSFAFLNWDDQAVVLQNQSLQFPGVVGWAFTTTYMEHYQPLSWLVWAAIKAGFGVDAAAFHLANVLVHLACVLLVWRAARVILALAWPDVPAVVHDPAAIGAALLFGVHPLRVEVVAWISAMPYALALALLLASLLAYMRASVRPSLRWGVAAVMLYAASLSARPVGMGFPVVLLVLDAWLLGRRTRASLAGVWPYAVLAVAAAAVEAIARAPGLNQMPWLYRLQSAASAPFVYLWHTVVPVDLTPLDVLPIAPLASPGVVLAALLALAGVSCAAWWRRRRWPALSAAWAAYLALLAPAAGLIASGLQATADRYTYVPGVVVAIAVAGAGARWAAGRSARTGLVAAAVLVLAVASAIGARRSLAPWSDSVSLWTRVVSLDPTHDVGLYNLGEALAGAGRHEQAAARYRELLALQPAHAQARANLDRLDAARREREANDLAARGDLAAAADRYQQAIALDPGRRHSHAGRGMALATLGHASEAMPSLREAMRQGDTDPAIPNALAVLLLQAGQPREARVVLESALSIHKNDVSLAHNLARLLATSAAHDPKDAALALRLAGAVVEATGQRDARAMETLAAALAANGRMEEAVERSARAAALATARGDRDLAVQITARGRAYRRPRQDDRRTKN